MDQAVSFITPAAVLRDLFRWDSIEKTSSDKDPVILVSSGFR